MCPKAIKFQAKIYIFIPRVINIMHSVLDTF